MGAGLSRDDVHDIGEVLVRYASGIDRRDWALFRSCFTDDCTADYGDIGVWHGAEEITTWMDQVHAAFGPTLHRITNVDVRPHGPEDHPTIADGGTGGGADRAVARCYVDVLLVFADGQGSIRGAGYYDDVVVRTDAGWRIAERTFTNVAQRTETLDGP